MRTNLHGVRYATRSGAPLLGPASPHAGVGLVDHALEILAVLVVVEIAWLVALGYLFAALL